MLLVLAGTIGAGKTSLTKMLAEHYNSKPFYESVGDNPVLPLFYKDPNKYAFLLQIYFLNKRFDAIKAAMAQDDNILDRSIYEDSLLFHLNADLGRATPQEVAVYDSLLANMMQELPYAAHKKSPDLLVFVDVSFKTMLERIKQRGRSYEQIDQDPSLYDYYRELQKRYRTWYDNYDASPKMRIDGDRYDYVNDPDAAKIVMQMIDKENSNR